MPRVKFQTLTEQMYYILLCLHRECYGMDIMDQIPAMTGGGSRWAQGPCITCWRNFWQRG